MLATLKKQLFCSLAARFIRVHQQGTSDILYRMQMIFTWLKHETHVSNFVVLRSILFCLLAGSIYAPSRAVLLFLFVDWNCREEMLASNKWTRQGPQCMHDDACTCACPAELPSDQATCVSCSATAAAWSSLSKRRRKSMPW